MSNPHTIEGEYTENLPTVTSQPGVTIINAPKPTALDLSSPSAFDRAVTTVENALAYKSKVLELAVRTSRPGAIVDQDGVPYFTEPEAERILSLLGGGRITITQAPRREEEEDGNFEYTATVEVTHPVLGTFSGFGSAHSADKFLGTNNGKSRRTLENVSRHNIAQHALTRAKGSAIRRMLGLDGFSWDDLGAMGLERGKGATVSYGKGGKSSGGSGGRPRSSGGGSASGSKGRMVEAMKAADLNWSNLSNFAKAMGWYDGEKILDAPAEVMDQITAAILESPDDVRAA